MFPDLSESHRSRIRITLTILGEALGKFTEWAQGREVRAVLNAEANGLPPRQKYEILSGVLGSEGHHPKLAGALLLVNCPTF
jgi:hypothetical protein